MELVWKLRRILYKLVPFQLIFANRRTASGPQDFEFKGW